MKPIVLNSGVIYLNELDSDTILDAIDDLTVRYEMVRLTEDSLMMKNAPKIGKFIKGLQ